MSSEGPIYTAMMSSHFTNKDGSGALEKVKVVVQYFLVCPYVGTNFFAVFVYLSNYPEFHYMKWLVHPKVMF